MNQLNPTKRALIIAPQKYDLHKQHGRVQSVYEYMYITPRCAELHNIRKRTTKTTKNLILKISTSRRGILPQPPRTTPYLNQQQHAHNAQLYATPTRSHQHANSSFPLESPRPLTKPPCNLKTAEQNRKPHDFIRVLVFQGGTRCLTNPNRPRLHFDWSSFYPDPTRAWNALSDQSHQTTPPF